MSIPKRGDLVYCCASRQDALLINSRLHSMIRINSFGIFLNETTCLDEFPTTNYANSSNYMIYKVLIPGSSIALFMQDEVRIIR